MDNKNHPQCIAIGIVTVNSASPLDVRVCRFAVFCVYRGSWFRAAVVLNLSHTCKPLALLLTALRGGCMTTSITHSSDVWLYDLLCYSQL